MSIDEKISYIENHILYKYFLSEYDFPLSALDYVINTINDECITTDEVIKDSELTTKKFIILLKYIIDKTNSILASVIYNSEYFFDNIMDNDEDMIIDYFNSDFNYNVLDKKINRLIINGFIDNAKYIYVYKDILKNNNIEYKNIYEYTDEEVLKIIQLLINIGSCIPKTHISTIFSRIIKYVDNEDEIKNYYNNDAHYYKLDVIKYEITVVDKLIQEYNLKKNYLNYFEVE